MASPGDSTALPQALLPALLRRPGQHVSAAVDAVSGWVESVCAGLRGDAADPAAGAAEAAAALCDAIRGVAGAAEAPGAGAVIRSPADIGATVASAAVAGAVGEPLFDALAEQLGGWVSRLAEAAGAAGGVRSRRRTVPAFM
jgi:hypothetical protein